MSWLFFGQHFLFLFHSVESANSRLLSLPPDFWCLYLFFSPAADLFSAAHRLCWVQRIHSGGGLIFCLLFAFRKGRAVLVVGVFWNDNLNIRDFPICLLNKNRLCSTTCGSKNMIGKRYKGSHPEEKSGQGVTDPIPKKIISGKKKWHNSTKG